MTSIRILYEPFIRNRRSLDRDQRTIDEYGLATRQLVEYLELEHGTDDIELVDRPLLENFLIHYMKRHSSTTANKMYRSLRSMFNWLHGEELIQLNPFVKMKAPPVKSRQRYGYTQVEVSEILSLVRQQRQGGYPVRESYLASRDHAIMLVLYDTGLRASEVIAMQPTSVDFTTGLFEVPGKGGKTYRKHLGRTTLLALSNYLRVRGKSTGKLWLSHDGQPLTRSGLLRMCKKRAVEAGVKSGDVHRWRYTHAEVLQDLGWPEEIIMAEMGHSAREISRHYREAAITRAALKRHEQQSPADLLSAP